MSLDHPWVYKVGSSIRKLPGFELREHNEIIVPNHYIQGDYLDREWNNWLDQEVLLNSKKESATIVTAEGEVLYLYNTYLLTYTKGQLRRVVFSYLGRTVCDLPHLGPALRIGRHNPREE